MSSGRKSSKISKQEQTDRAIAVFVVLLFLGITMFFMTGRDQPEIIEQLKTTAIHEDIPDEDLYDDELDISSEEMEIEGKTYRMERESSRAIDRSYHRRASDETPPSSHIPEENRNDQGHSDHDQDFKLDDGSYDQQKQAATSVEETVDEVVEPVTTATSTVEEVVQEVVEAPIVAKQESKQNQQATSGNPADCVIIIGGYKNPSNISKMRNRLERDNYDHFTVPFRDLTRVGVRVPCDPDSYGPELRTIRRTYAEDAVLLQPK